MCYRLILSIEVILYLIVLLFLFSFDYFLSCKNDPFFTAYYTVGNKFSMVIFKLN